MTRGTNNESGIPENSRHRSIMNLRDTALTPNRVKDIHRGVLCLTFASDAVRNNQIRRMLDRLIL